MLRLNLLAHTTLTTETERHDQDHAPAPPVSRVGVGRRGALRCALSASESVRWSKSNESMNESVRLYTVTRQIIQSKSTVKDKAIKVHTHAE